MVAPPSRSLSARIAVASQALRDALGFAPRFAGVLGAGQQGLVEHLADARVLDPRAIAAELRFDHDVPLCAGWLFGLPTVLCGPILPAHAGYDLVEATLPLRVLRAAGVQVVLLTAGAASLSDALVPGAIAVLRDHLDADRQNPLRGPLDSELGPRFLDQDEPYAPRLRALWSQACAESSEPCAEVTFAGIRGPALPSRAEQRLWRSAGVQALGMSLLPEAVVARHAGMDVLAALAITQQLSPERGAPTAIADMLAAADLAVPRLQRAMVGFARRLAERASADA